MFWYKFLLSCLVLILTGCAGISKKDCLETNWHAVGESDGKNGVTARDLTKSAKYCSNDALKTIGTKGLDYPTICDPDKFTTAQTSWGQGIDSYCNADNGLIAGSAGRRINKHCDKARHSVYFANWEQGVTKYCSQPSTAFYTGKDGGSIDVECPAQLAADFMVAFERGKQVKLEISNAKSRLSSLNTTIASLSSDINTNSTKIRNIRNDIVSNEQAILKLENNILEYEAKKSQQEQEIAAAKANNSYYSFVHNYDADISNCRASIRRKREDIIYWQNSKIPALADSTRQLELNLNRQQNEVSMLEQKITMLQQSRY